MQVIPFQAFPEQTFRVTLGGILYTWRVYWSEFDETLKELAGADYLPGGKWYADIEGGQLRIGGMGLVSGCDLFERFGIPEIGQLWIVDSEEKLTDVSYESLGVNHQIVFIPYDATL